MVLQGDETQVEARSVCLEIVLILAPDRCTVYAKRTIGSKNRLGHSKWYFKVMRLKWKLDSVCLAIVLILMQDRCTVSAECIIGSEVIWDAPDGTPR